MEDFVERSLLFDFYGELLTEHQRKIYSAIVFEDYSVSEIAREEGISRQGVHDLRKRCDRILEEYEERLHLVERFVRIREQIKKIRSLTADTAENNAVIIGESTAENTAESTAENTREYTGYAADGSRDTGADLTLKTALREIDQIAVSILEDL